MCAQVDKSGKHTPGLHGENLLKNVYLYHVRIAENAHLINIKYCVGNPNE